MRARNIFLEFKKGWVYKRIEKACFSYQFLTFIARMKPAGTSMLLHAE
jgi:hypothetical protein